MTSEAKSYAVPSRRKHTCLNEPETAEADATSSGVPKASTLQDALQEIRAMREERLCLLEERQERVSGRVEPEEPITGQSFPITFKMF
ncbi:hypothetical protein EAI_03425 [Harpegnathos saltator]|uniref:Uncharacterized protein n=1 Tax=Harpegnathos saltator TaxID=610380 RepID=E2BAX1_HARSA|nr:hypothetical protein EAI_03425 [Harpegnathos saltator]